MQNEAILIAQKAVAAFLNCSKTDISCTVLHGGSNEDTIVQSSYLDKSYVVKVFGKSKSGENEIAWTKLGSDLGISPLLFYADPHFRFMIMALADGHSLIPSTANEPWVIQKIATHVAKLHNSSAPFAHESNMFDRMETKYKKINSSGMLKALLEKTFKKIMKIKTEFQNINVSPVPCHNDLNWGNIFIGNNIVSFIDWGDAALGNPLYDIAVFFVLNTTEPKNEEIFFKSYETRLSSIPEGVALCKQIVHFEFALNLLSGVQAMSPQLLQAQELASVEDLNVYLTLLARREAMVDGSFLHKTAIASLSKIIISKS